MIGLPKTALDTPVLWVDLDRLEQNIATLARHFREAGVQWRPHTKGSKIPAIAHKLLAAGAIGITCAKLSEAEVMVAAGIKDILVANQITGQHKLPRLANLCRQADVKVAVDNPRNVAALAAQLVERHGGQVPSDRAALEALPGVGRKTANVVLNVAFGQNTMAVDTHIFRLGNRTGLAPGKTTRAVEEGLMKRCPPELLRDAHHWLILHGRYICKARAPECWRCPARASCNYRDKVLAPPT